MSFDLGNFLQSFVPRPLIRYCSVLSPSLTEEEAYLEVKEVDNISSIQDRQSELFNYIG